MGTIIFYPVTLTLEFDSFFLKTLTLFMTFEQWVLELLYFSWKFLVIRSFFVGTFWPWHLTYFLKIHIGQIFLIINIRDFILQMSIVPTGIKILVIVTLTIFGIGHYRGHIPTVLSITKLCNRQTFYWLCASQDWG